MGLSLSAFFTKLSFAHVITMKDYTYFVRSSFVEFQQVMLGAF
jgi:hypothetical protein